MEIDPNLPLYAQGFYNGFDLTERRVRAARVFKAMRQERIVRPSRCHACGQTDAIAHSEDYALISNDYWPVCYLCHKMLHERHRDPELWHTYRERIRDGERGPVLVDFDWRAFNRAFRDGHRRSSRGLPVSMWPAFTRSNYWTPNMELFDRLVDAYTGSVAPGLDHTAGDPLLVGMVIDPYGPGIPG